MRAVKILIGTIAAASILMAAPTSASADSTHICQGSRNCNDGNGGGGGGGGHGHGHGGKDKTVKCTNDGGGLIVLQLNVCPTDFPILVDIL